MSSKSDFVNSMYRAGLQAGLTDSAARVMAAQAAIESTYGASAPGNNFFGIIAGPDWTGPTVTRPDKDAAGNQIMQQFRVYDSPEAGIADRVSTMRAQFPAFSGATTMDEALASLQHGNRGVYYTASQHDYEAAVAGINKKYMPAAPTVTTASLEVPRPPAAVSTSSSLSDALNARQYGKPGGGVGVNAEELNPEFARRLDALISAAEKATGDKVAIFEGYRDPKRSAQLHASYTGEPVTYEGVTYQPVPSMKGKYQASGPGVSEHNFGMAGDIRAGNQPDKFPSGPAYQFMVAHAGEYGLENLGASDPAHFQIPQAEFNAFKTGGQVAEFKLPTSAPDVETAVAAIGNATRSPNAAAYTQDTGAGGRARTLSDLLPSEAAYGVTGLAGDKRIPTDWVTNGVTNPQGFGAPGAPLTASPYASDYETALMVSAGTTALQQVTNTKAKVEGANIRTGVMAVGGVFGEADDELSGGVIQGGKVGDVPLPRGRASSIGMLQPGNIDLNNRPVFFGSDGSYRTENSISVSTDAGEVLIPTVVNGKQVSDEDAIKHYQQTGENLGVFVSPDAADAYAEQLHLRNQGLSNIVVPMPGRPVALDGAEPAPPASPAEKPQLVRLPTGAMITPGTYVNKKTGIATVITAGPNGEAVITPQRAGILNIPKEIAKGSLLGRVAKNYIGQQVAAQAQTVTAAVSSTASNATMAVKEKLGDAGNLITAGLSSLPSLGGLFGFGGGGTVAVKSGPYEIPQSKAPAQSWPDAVRLIVGGTSNPPAPTSVGKSLEGTKYATVGASLDQHFATVAAPTVQQTKSEQVQERQAATPKPAKPSQGTITPPTVTKAPAATPKPAVTWAPKYTDLPKVQTTKLVTVTKENPDYVRYQQQQSRTVGEDTKDLHGTANVADPLAPPPTITTTKRVTVATPSPASAPGTYVVQPGDTLSTIAARNGMTPAQLQAMNGGAVIQPGAKLNTGSSIQMSHSIGSSSAVAAVTLASGRTVPVGAQGSAQGGRYQYVVQSDGSVVNVTTGHVTAPANQNGGGGNGIGTTWDRASGGWVGGGQ